MLVTIRPAAPRRGVGTSPEPSGTGRGGAVGAADGGGVGAAAGGSATATADGAADGAAEAADGVLLVDQLDRLLAMVQRSRILCVASHTNTIIEKICNKALWLHQGSLIAYGDVDEVLAAYKQGGV